MDDRPEPGMQRSGEAIELVGEESTCSEEQYEETIGSEDDHYEVMPQERYVDRPEYDRHRRTGCGSLKSWEAMSDF